MVTSIKGNDTSTFGGNIDVPQIITDAPAFSAYLSADQSISTASFTKIAFDTEQFDTNSNYDNTTNYRFTPTVEGYYQINSNMAINQSGNIMIELYKNGSWVVRGMQQYNTATATRVVNLSYLVYMNGTTDYLEIYGYQSSGTTKNISGSSRYTNFQAFLARAV